jgi:hypothetical protein
MSNSVLQNPQGTFWPLGFVPVANNGVPVNIMSVVDPGMNNAPWTPTGPGSGQGAEFSPTCHRIWIQAVKPGNANIGWQNTTGNVYVLMPLGPGNQNSGGAGNKADSGVLIAMLLPGGFVNLPSMEFDGPTISPYGYVIDADTNGDGANVVLVNCSRG